MPGRWTAVESRSPAVAVGTVGRAPYTSSVQTARMSGSSRPQRQPRPGQMAGTLSSIEPTSRGTGSWPSATARDVRFEPRASTPRPSVRACHPTAGGCFTSRPSTAGRFRTRTPLITPRARNWLVVTDLRTGRSRRVSNERGLYFVGTTPWSPDGTRFTFTRRNYLQATGGRIYVASPSGGEPQFVADDAREAGAWSPDGLRLAFNVGNVCAVRVVATDGSSPARLLPFKGCLPTWRPEP
jgi:hypothetical protein